MIWPQRDDAYTDFNPIQSVFSSRNHFLPFPLLAWASWFEKEHTLRFFDEAVRPFDENELGEAGTVLIYVGRNQCSAASKISLLAGNAGRTILCIGPEAALAGPTCTLPSLPRLPPGAPRFDLVDIKTYGSLAVQSSEGMDEFCSFAVPSVRLRPRMRRPLHAFLRDLETLYAQNGPGKTIYLADDDFLGDLSDPENYAVVRELVAAVGQWQLAHDGPFDFFVRCSPVLADFPELHKCMVKSGMSILFLEIRPQQPDLPAWQPPSKARLETLRSAGFGAFVCIYLNRPLREENGLQPFLEWTATTSVPVAGLFIRSEETGDAVSCALMQKRFLELIYRPDAYFSRCRRWVAGWNHTPVMGGKKGSIPANLLVSRIIKDILHQGVMSAYRLVYWRYWLTAVRRYFRTPDKLALCLYLSYFYRVLRPFSRNKKSNR